MRDLLEETEESAPEMDSEVIRKGTIPEKM
jgi:hypothetical protein